MYGNDGADESAWTSAARRSQAEAERLGLHADWRKRLVNVLGSRERSQGEDGSATTIAAAGDAVPENGVGPQRTYPRQRRTLVRRALVGADLLALSASFLIAEQTVGAGGYSSGEFVVFAITIPCWLLLMNLFGLYNQDEERTDHSTADDVVPLLHAVTLAVFVYQGALWAAGRAEPDFAGLLAFWASALLLATLGRVAVRQMCRRSPSFVQNVVIVGADDAGRLIARKLLQHREYGLNLVGFVDGNGAAPNGPLAHVPLLGLPSELPELIAAQNVERVIITGDAGASGIELIHRLKRCDVQIDIVPRLFEAVGPGASMHKVEGIPLIGLPPSRLSRASMLVKRMIDIVISAILIVPAAPLMAWIAWRVRRDSPGPAFFRQTRLGLNMREISMIKFRTMRVDTADESHREYIKQIMDPKAEPNANGLYKLDRDDDVTPFGRWLRKTSLDELPQLLNVLKGDMSLVGPRPCLPYEVNHFEPHHFERFFVPPGVTGLWQVTARARSTFVEALEMDVAYARGWSLGLDLWLLARTPFQLLREATR